MSSAKSYLVHDSSCDAAFECSWLNNGIQSHRSLIPAQVNKSTVWSATTSRFWSWLGFEDKSINIRHFQFANVVRDDGGEWWNLSRCGLHNYESFTYCQRSGSGPPWLMGHFAFFCWMKGHKCKVSCYKGASIGHIYALKSSSGGMWWSSLKTCPIIKNCPKMAVFLFRVTYKFQMLLGRTGQL